MILRRLGLESEAMSLPELLVKLGTGFTERSVRRWVGLLVREGAIKKIGQKRGSKYTAVGQLQGGSDNTIGSCLSFAVKAVGFDEIRRRYRQERRALISKAIRQGIVGKDLDKYVIEETDRLIPVAARREFVNDVMEDLRERDESR